jgi:hypothetical protein
MSALGQKQTCAVHSPMSALCQQRTSKAGKAFPNFAGETEGRDLIAVGRTQ